MTRATTLLVLVVSVLWLCNQASAQAGDTSAAPAAATTTAPASGADAVAASWPRTFQKDGDSVTVYQPQIDAWKDHSKIRFRCAVVIMLKDDSHPYYGVMAGQADTMVDNEAHKVLMTNLEMSTRLPGTDGDKAKQAKAVAEAYFASMTYLDVPLDNVLACIRDTAKLPKADVGLKPPPIYYSSVPAILIIYTGKPVFKPVQKAELDFAVNTNWVILKDRKTSMYYILDGDGWLVGPDPLKGPWTRPGVLPDSFSQLPKDGNWQDVRDHVPGRDLKEVPRVLISTEPAELIVTHGLAQYEPIPGTQLVYASNPVTPLFMDVSDDTYYYLAAGRWFRTKDIFGTWTAASSDLPAEFAKIPPDSPVGFVLASVPNTQEAKDAIVLASVPHKATIDRKKATLDVTYDGQPKFAPIQGTQMTYAINTPYEVIGVGTTYYCCYQGVWFTGPGASGPWSVCTSLPPEISTIPPSCPVYNTTYCYVYGSTPDSVQVGYTAGYCGEYLASTGVLMFGAGLAWGALADNNWYGCGPCYCSYGCGVAYSYAYGGYYRSGDAWYGPHGGVGWGAAYNAKTGTWARGGYAYGPAGAHWGAQAYNPWTNTYAQHTGGTNGYRTWGSTAVSQDGHWAQAGHVSGPAGSKGWVETSSGKDAVGARTAGGAGVAATSNGDLYAGKDGNLYRKSDGQWQKYSGSGSWEDTSYNRPAAHTTGQLQSSAQTEEGWRNRTQAAPAQTGMGQSWRSDFNSSAWKNEWQNSGRSNFQDDYARERSQQDTMSSLNRDSWSRDHSNFSRDNFSQRSGAWGGGRGWSGGGGERFGGSAFHGGGGGGFRGGGRR